MRDIIFGLVVIVILILAAVHVMANIDIPGVTLAATT